MALLHFVDFGEHRALPPLAECVIGEHVSTSKPKRVTLWTSHPEWPARVPTSLVDSGIAVERIDLSTFAQTPLFSWYNASMHNGFMHNCYANFLMGDALKLAVLYKQGGIYLDSDVLPLAPPPLGLAAPVRAVTLQSAHDPRDVNNAILFFPQRDPCLHALSTSRRGSNLMTGHTLCSLLLVVTTSMLCSD